MTGQGIERFKKAIEKIKQDKTVRTYSELKQAHLLRVERIVCSGGGAKGVVYPGAYKAMVEAGLFQGVQEVSGTSAGAITAAFMAIGMPPNTLREKLLTNNMKELMGSHRGVDTNATGVSFITKDGKPFLQFIQENIIGVLKVYAEELLQREGLADDIKHLLEHIQSARYPRITFGHLALLNQHFPEYFKKLTIPAVTLPDGELHIFNCEQTPDVEIALACRASAAIPVVLEPVDIEVQGVTRRFVDGGMYDNLPTDYFDQDSNGNFTKNQRPSQTLVFAFGEGLDNKKNNVHQALHNARWDEIVNSIIENAVAAAMQCAPPEQDEESIHDLAKWLEGAVGAYLSISSNEQCNDEVILAQSKLIQSILVTVLKKIEKDPQGYNESKTPTDKLALLVSLVKQEITPELYKAGFIEKVKRNYLPSALAGFNAAYKNTDQKEEGYQKLRSEYPLRTVELRVGDIKTTDFKKATELARIMDANGFLDTINHITNHHLFDSSIFSEEQFYQNLLMNFSAIYAATLLAAGKKGETDSLIKEINALQAQLDGAEKSSESTSKQIYHLIKERAESDLYSIPAFALSRAVELHNMAINPAQLADEIYSEGAKYSSQKNTSLQEVKAKIDLIVQPKNEPIAPERYIDFTI